jgi:hypothetical protein
LVSQQLPFKDVADSCTSDRYAAGSALTTLGGHGRKTGRLKYSEECNTSVYNQSGFRIERHSNTNNNLLWLSKIGYTERLD